MTLIWNGISRTSSRHDLIIITDEFIIGNTLCQHFGAASPLTTKVSRLPCDIHGHHPPPPPPPPTLPPKKLKDYAAQWEFGKKEITLVNQGQRWKGEKYLASRKPKTTRRWDGPKLLSKTIGLFFFFFFPLFSPSSEDYARILGLVNQKQEEAVTLIWFPQADDDNELRKVSVWSYSIASATYLGRYLPSYQGSSRAHNATTHILHTHKHRHKVVPWIHLPNQEELGSCVCVCVLWETECISGISFDDGNLHWQLAPIFSGIYLD